MALKAKKAHALQLRHAGASYSQIQKVVKVSKSSLSLWLRDYPLSKKRVDELRGKNQTRIERFRETMRAKRESRLIDVRVKALSALGSLTERDVFIGGLFLYWGEGTKTAPACTAIANTDPAMIRFYIQWLRLLGVSRKKMRVKLHLYKNMNIGKEVRYWSTELNLPVTQFRKPYVKSSSVSDLTYTQRFAHGTCNVIVDGRDLSEKILMTLDCIRSRFADKS